MRTSGVARGGVPALFVVVDSGRTALPSEPAMEHDDDAALDALVAAAPTECMSSDDIPVDAVAPAGEEIDHPCPKMPASFARVLHPRKRALLVAMSTTPNLGLACRAAGITRQSMYDWLKRGEPEFDLAYKEARDMGIRAAEDEAWKRATEGTVEDVYGSLGQNLGTGVVGQKRVKSDTMLIFMLKGARPDVYRERFEHSGPNGGPIEVARVVREIVDPLAIEGEVIDSREIVDP